MDYTLPLIDLIRLAHLMCFAAGMGIAIFFDWRSVQSLQTPISRDDLGVLHEIHTWITVAFTGLWITGLTLIYVRTGFDPENVSPKLITKVLVMTAMVLNARAIARYVLPVFANNVGRCLTELPFSQMMILTQCAINSMYCWIAGVTLGASVVLKTAGWDVLLPVFGGAFLALTAVGQATVIGLLTWTRLTKAARLKRASAAATG